MEGRGARSAWLPAAGRRLGRGSGRAGSGSVRRGILRQPIAVTLARAVRRVTLLRPARRVVLAREHLLGEAELGNVLEILAGGAAKRPHRQHLPLDALDRQ